MIPWWTSQEAAAVGGVVGCIFGVVGANLAVKSWRGKHKVLVYRVAAVMMGSGILTLVWGVVAWLLQQPDSVYFPLMVLGVIFIVMVGGLIAFIRYRYQEADHRHLEAEELRRGS